MVRFIPFVALGDAARRGRLFERARGRQGLRRGDPQRPARTESAAQLPAEQGRPSWGDTDENGRFTLEYDMRNKGALVGKHTVSASYLPAPGDEEMSGKMPDTDKAVTAKYGDMQNSPLKIDIQRSTDNLEVKFD